MGWAAYLLWEVEPVIPGQGCCLAKLVQGQVTSIFLSQITCSGSKRALNAGPLGQAYSQLLVGKNKRQ